MNPKFVIGGIALLIAAVIAVIKAQPMYRQAAHIYMFENMAAGNDLRMIADVVKYGGIATGAVGAILLLTGLLKK